MAKLGVKFSEIERNVPYSTLLRLKSDIPSQSKNQTNSPTHGVSRPTQKLRNNHFEHSNAPDPLLTTRDADVKAKVEQSFNPSPPTSRNSKSSRQEAQGCEERATLGHGSPMESNPDGVVTKTYFRLAG